MQSTFWTIITLLFMSLATGVGHAQTGGRDYYAPRLTNDDRSLFENVEKFHLPQAQAQRGKTTFPSVKGDLDFILRYYPNHPVALDLMSQLCVASPLLAGCDMEDYFAAAIAVNPRAAPTFVVYGIHLQRKGRIADAVLQYRKALQLNANSVNAHYNMALALFDLKQFEESNAHAQVAYALGAPYPGLRDKLTRAAQWKVLDEAQMAHIIQQGSRDGASADVGPSLSKPAEKERSSSNSKASPRPVGP
jgi:tetratricopeptide (TPR) repeat protein